MRLRKARRSEARFRVKPGMTERLFEAVAFGVAEAAEEVGGVETLLSGGLDAEDAQGVTAAANLQEGLAVGGDVTGRTRVVLGARHDIAVEELDAQFGAVLLDG